MRCLALDRVELDGNIFMKILKLSGLSVKIVSVARLSSLGTAGVSSS
jgi:hypothetical protein